MFREFKNSMIQELEMTDIELISSYLGIEVRQYKDGNFISQKSYTKFILEKFNMKDNKSVDTL